MMLKCLVVVYMPLREMVVTRSESLNGSRRSKAVLTCEVALHVDLFTVHFSQSSDEK
jgi:hypothetical protein